MTNKRTQLSASSIEQARQKSKHITTACLGCRKKKIKCDGAIPKCSHCVLYSEECAYQHGIDKRKIPTKERISNLEHRCALLESLLTENGIPLPTFQDNATMAKAETVGRGPELSRLGPINLLFEDGFPLAVDFSPFDQRRWTAPAAESGSRPIFPEKATEPRRKRLERPSEEHGSDDHSSDVDALIDQLSGRIGSLQIAEDGQLRFYGATSNLHILHNGPLSLNRPRVRSVHNDWQAALQSANLGDKVHPELEDHLLKLYFCWEDPSIHVVNEAIFWREQKKCKTGGQTSHAYSELLTNAICSVGASLSSREFTGLPEPLTEFFAKRSEVLLGLEMDSPTLSTVQSLVILSAVEALLTRDARGWLYSGMAARLAVDLGLHLDLQAYVNAEILHPEEAMLRSTVFWDAFVHDRMWSLYGGRPVALEDKHITLPRPSGIQATLEQRTWEPYVDECEGFDLHLPNPIEEVSRCNVSLCAKMSSIRENLYSDGKTASRSLEHIHTFAVKMQSELHKWHSTLPEALRIDESDTTTFYLPHVLQLHMQYHCVMILVNRPFFSASNRLCGITPADIAACRKECTDSAASITGMVRIFRRLYSLRRINVQAVHLIFTASLIHVYMLVEPRT